MIVLTPPGRGAVATVRVEGARATELVARRFHSVGGKPLADFAMGQVAFGRWGSPDGEEVVVCRRPESDRGGQRPDAVEVHCHGGQVAVRAIADALVELGCQDQKWHDWIGSHASDRVVAEAQIALGQARTMRTAGVLLDQMQGALSREVALIQERWQNDRRAAQQRIAALLAFAELGRHLVEPWRIVLAGRPNVGKSSLINAILGYQRAIVFDQPGTTRDAVTAVAALDGWPVELTDTAGLRDEAEALEAAGIAEARRQLASADVVVLVFDTSQPWTTADTALVKSWPDAVRIHNKCDLACAEDARPWGIRTCALTGEGLPTLIEDVARRLVPNPPPPGQAIPFTPRQVDLLQQALAAVSSGDVAVAGGHLRALCRSAVPADKIMTKQPTRVAPRDS